MGYFDGLTASSFKKDAETDAAEAERFAGGRAADVRQQKNRHRRDKKRPAALRYNAHLSDAGSG